MSVAEPPVAESPTDEESVTRETYDAAYMLESAVKCPGCAAAIVSVHVVRLLRAKVNFTSTLPRRGYVVCCPSCRVVLPAAIGSRLV